MATLWLSSGTITCPKLTPHTHQQLIYSFLFFCFLIRITCWVPKFMREGLVPCPNFMPHVQGTRKACCYAICYSSTSSTEFRFNLQTSLLLFLLPFPYTPILRITESHVLEESFVWEIIMADYFFSNI